MNNTTTTAIEHLPKDQTITLQTPDVTHTLLAKPVFRILHQHFPNASFEVLDTLIKGNAAYGLYLAKQNNLVPIETVPALPRTPVPGFSKGAFMASVLYPQPSAA